MTHQINPRIRMEVSALLLVMASLAHAATITVGPGAGYDFDTIQAGIDAARDGDTVLVALGEYVISEPITFRGKAITVKSESGRDQTTIRMGTPVDSKRASVVIFENNETVDSVLEGFTITRGKGSWVTPLNGSVGGGIYFNASSGTVKNCLIAQNSATYQAGVNSDFTCMPTLIDCIITENSADENTGGVGTAVGASMTLTNCVISRNSAEKYYGGASCAEGATLILENCIITENSAGSGGGGVGCNGADTSLGIRNCTICGNSSGNYLNGYGGGGIACYGGSSATVTNSIIRENTSSLGYEILLQQNPTEFSITYCNIAGGRSSVSVEGGCVLNWGEGNIDTDPFFARLGYLDDNGTRDPSDDVWVEDDFHLKSQAGRWDPESQNWIQDDVTSPCIDAGDPNTPVAEETEPNGGIINLGAYGGTAEASMSPFGVEEIVYIQWLGHSTVKVWTEEGIVYVDPERVPDALHDATLVCVTHTHGDHYSPSDIAKVSNAQTQFVGPPDVVQSYGRGQTIAPGQMIEFDFVNVIAVPAYNTNKSNHPRSNNWVGYIFELGTKRIYVAGDTDLIDEMRTLGEISAAFLPAGGTYTMNAVEAAEATQYIKPDLAIPYHWGQNVGTLADAQRFAELARCAVKILAVGETIRSDEWPEYQPLIAHWALDESEGDVAYDETGGHDGALNGGPAWLPEGGKIDGALQFDGVDDYVSATTVLDPAEGVFSAFAWVKGGAPGQVVLSQTGAGGETWIGADSLGGFLVSGLVPPPAGRTVTPALESQFVITDDLWHHVGFVWDGSRRHLYADGVEVAVDAGSVGPLTSSDGGMTIGAGIDATNFWLGLIDDVRIYDQALDVEEVEALAR